MHSVPSTLSSRGRRYFLTAAKRSPQPTLQDLGLPPALQRTVESWDEIWGGYEFEHYKLGVASSCDKATERMLTTRTHDGKIVVLAAVLWSNQPIYLDEDGQIYERPLWWATAPLRFLATSMESFVAHYSLKSWVGGREVAVELQRPFAAELAAEVGLNKIEDTDWWGDVSDNGVLICNGEPYVPNEPITTIRGSLEQVIGLLRVVQKLDADMVVTVIPRPVERSVYPSRSEQILPPSQAPTGAIGPLQLRYVERQKDGVRQIQGIVDLNDDNRLRVLTLHDGKVTTDTQWSTNGVESYDYLDAQEYLKTLVSEHARPLVPAGRDRLDPTLKLRPEEARELLTALGIEPWDSLIELEQKLGGLLLSGDWQLGLSGLFHEKMLRDLGKEATPLNQGRVPFALVGDSWLLADEVGRLHYVDDIDGTDNLAADSVSTFIERFVRVPFGLELFTNMGFSVPAFIGVEFAAALKVPLDTTLSDSAELHWMDERVHINERPGREGEVHTDVAVRSLEHLTAVVAALPKTDHAMQTVWVEVREAIENAGFTVQRTANERRFAPEPDEDALVAVGRAGAQELAKLAEHSSAKVRRAVAEHPQTSLEVLNLLVERTPPIDVDALVVLDAIARHPNADPELLERLAGLPGPPNLDHVVSRSVAMQDSTPANLLAQLGSHPTPMVRQAVALNPKTPPTTLTELATDDDLTVRIAVAENASTPPESLLMLSAQDEPKVLNALAANPSMSAEALERLSLHPHSSIFSALVKRDDLPTVVAERCAYHPHGMDVGTNKSLSQVAILDLSQSPHRQNRVDIASNPSTPQEVLLTLLEDADPGVRKLALGHPQLDENDLDDESKAQRVVAQKSHPLIAGKWKSPPGISPKESLGALLDRRVGDHRDGWARHASYPPALLAELVGHPGVLTTYNVAMHPFVTDEVLEELARGGDMNTLAQVGYNQRTPEHVLMMLLKTGGRAAAARQPKVPEAALRDLAKDPERSVIEGVAQNPNCPVDLLEVFAKHPHEYVRRWVAIHPNSPAALLSTLVDDDPQVSARLPLNPACPEDVVLAALKSADRQTRNAAIWRLLTSRPLEEILVL